MKQRVVRTIGTLSQAVGFNILAILPVIPVVRNHLHCPAEWWWSAHSRPPIAIAIPEYCVTLMLLEFALTTIHIWWHGQLARLHAYGVHHAVLEADLDWHVGQLFGPWEPMITMPTIWAMLLGLGTPLSPAVFVTATMTVFALWAHTPPRRWHHWPLIQQVFVTPVSHRIHHSPNPALYGRNCGFVFTLGDRAFGTYQAPSRS